ncbi:hypothetical protein HUT18_14365 [Streptomyces sp. NA04227]|uniref:hypothetical protein n=1 Tax=Streptomyces sp. NA04227 TaxID=2742136 RepID=UPI0015918881|nr:hypothetical protein [Streptomyces sp. NA04227]QKW07393.1 hypothetical protein HUT18_14365 [Streptomyces sp. NA04227]
MTVAAVLLGALTTHVTNFLMERSRNRYQLLTRWDDKKVETYGDYVEATKTKIAAAKRLYEQREGLQTLERHEGDLRHELADASLAWGRAFERVMLLGGDDAIEAGHDLNAALAEIDWQATGETQGTLDEWRERNRAVFRCINDFHEAAREDLGIQGKVKGENHPERDLLLPPARSPDDDATAAGAD